MRAETSISWSTMPAMSPRAHWRPSTKRDGAQGWDSKVFNYINLSREYFRRMKARGTGVIVNVTGIAGDLLDASYIAGSVGNAAMAAFTKALGSTSHKFGVRVVGVNPGPCATERFRTIGARQGAGAIR